MRIGIDIDGTLFHWTRSVNEAVEEQFGVEGLTEHTHWDYLHDTITPEQWKWVWSAEAAPIIFNRDDLIFNGASEVVNQLCNEHEIHFITHRNPSVTTEITAHWLANHFNNYAGVHVISSSIPKTTLGHWDIFIDDKPDTIQEFVALGIPILIPDRLYNRNIPGGGGYRFNSWDEVLWIIDTISGRMQEQLMLGV